MADRLGMWMQAIGIASSCWRAASQVSRPALRCSASHRDGVSDLARSDSDVAHPSWRASAVGVYRLWRDLGYAIGALIAGITRRCAGFASRDVAGGRAHVTSGVIVALRMRETLATKGT